MFLTGSELSMTAGGGDCYLLISLLTVCLVSEIVLRLFYGVFLIFLFTLSTAAFSKDSYLGRFSTSIVNGTSSFFGDYGC
jgi:hypothetical protein